MSLSQGQDPGSERGDASGRVRAVSGEDRGADPTGGAGDAGGTPEGHHGIHDSRGTLFVFSM